MHTLIYAVRRWLRARLTAPCAVPTPPATPSPATTLGVHPPAAPIVADPWVTVDGNPSERLSPWE